MTIPTLAKVRIRPAAPNDALGISKVWQAIVAERVYSAVDRAFTPEEQTAYLASLDKRESIFVAEDDGRIVGFQTLDLWSKFMASAAHVGQLGTFILRDARGRGVGEELANATFKFARNAGYEKLVIYVRASNTGAQAFYKSLGFRECGHLARQVKIDGHYDDEILLERAL
ncbi:MAG TPA: GNAT family N-acetyltransferase [Candidatus Binataceae bacterium]|nr:GNAT family N-acetyltransferase [Candidatus Binataceae bacterium]